MPSSFVKRVKITKLFYNINGQDHLGELSTKFSFFFPYFYSNMKMMSISLCTYVGIYLALLISLPIPFLYDANNSTDHGPGRRSRWSTFATLHVRFQCNGRLCRRRASQESQFVNMIKNDGFEDGSLPLRNAGTQRSFEIPTVPTYRSLTGL